jgi:hypothetical protein
MDLAAAYRATAYHVDGPTGRFTLRIDAHSPEADALLASNESATWAFVTAHNPGSVALSPPENAARHDQLLAEVNRRGLLAWPGVGIGDDGRWPAEESVFILGLTEAEAINLGRQFGQIAVVCGDLDGPARLCWI